MRPAAPPALALPAQIAFVNPKLEELAVHTLRVPRDSRYVAGALSPGPCGLLSCAKHQQGRMRVGL